MCNNILLKPLISQTIPERQRNDMVTHYLIWNVNNDPNVLSLKDLCIFDVSKIYQQCFQSLEKALTCYVPQILIRQNAYLDPFYMLEEGPVHMLEVLQEKGRTHFPIHSSFFAKDNCS